MALLLLLVILHLLCSVCSYSPSLRPFIAQRNALKVISGLHDFREQFVLDVARAAARAGASHIDIACSAALVKAVKREISLSTSQAHSPSTSASSLSSSSVSVSSAEKSREPLLPLLVCVSGITPVDFVAAVEAGADMVEIGNFDGFYKHGRVFSAVDVLDMARATRRLLPSEVALSVTVPHTLSLEEQMELAKELEYSGADVIQTEGKVLPMSSDRSPEGSIQRAASTLASAFALAQSTSIPVMCSSGLDELTAPMALRLGAKGVGIGRYITQHSQDPQKMESVIRCVAKAMERPSTSAETIESLVDNLAISSKTKNKLFANFRM